MTACAGLAAMAGSCRWVGSFWATEQGKSRGPLLPVGGEHARQEGRWKGEKKCFPCLQREQYGFRRAAALLVLVVWGFFFLVCVCNAMGSCWLLISVSYTERLSFRANSLLVWIKSLSPIWFSTQSHKSNYSNITFDQKQQKLCCW